MNREEQNSYLHCVIQIGELILVNGGEVSRVEDAISRMLHSFGAEEVNVFCITSNLTVTVIWPQNYSDTQMRRIKKTENNFERLDLLNDLSRRICHEHPTPKQIRQETRDILQRTRVYPELEQIVTYALISGSFTLFFGGSIKDVLVSALIGIVLRVLKKKLDDTEMNMCLSLLCISLIGGALAHVFELCGLCDNPTLVSLGNIMLFIPGLAFTNSIRDLFVGDTIAGGIKLLESVLYAIVIAVGFTFGFHVWWF